MITLGIDTSNYTTSAAIFDGINFKMSRKILDIKQGMRGIRQSEGVFIHNRELPYLIEDMIHSSEEQISAIGVSTRPRNVDGSYMPVFTVGSGYAKALAATLNVPLVELSHQDGHIMAGIYSANALDLLQKPFISVHLSGGTTEILETEYDGKIFHNKIQGGTLDISAGQLIDRIGVAMGLKFPCGKKMEELAETTNEYMNLPFSIKDGYVNLSGIETRLIREVNGIDAKIARTVLMYISKVLVKAINNAINKSKLDSVLIVGGVASNSIIRANILKNVNANVYFASKELSTDNAVGCSILAYNFISG